MVGRRCTELTYSLEGCEVCLRGPLLNSGSAGCGCCCSLPVPAMDARPELSPLERWRSLRLPKALPTTSLRRRGKGIGRRGDFRLGAQPHTTKAPYLWI